MIPCCEAMSFTNAYTNSSKVAEKNGMCPLYIHLINKSLFSATLEEYVVYFCGTMVFIT